MSLYILYALTVLNLFTFFLYGIDKWKAGHARWRIPERTLLLFAFIGGSIGAMAGMHVWRHKTRHKKFRYGVPSLFVLQTAAAVWFIYGQ